MAQAFAAWPGRETMVLRRPVWIMGQSIYSSDCLHPGKKAKRADHSTAACISGKTTDKHLDADCRIKSQRPPQFPVSTPTDGPVNGAALTSRLAMANRTLGNRTPAETERASQVVLMVKSLPANTGDARDMGSISGFRKIPWSRQWQPTPVFFPGESHGQRSLEGYSPQGSKELDMTEQGNSKQQRLRT